MTLQNGSLGGWKWSASSSKFSRGLWLVVEHNGVAFFDGMAEEKGIEKTIIEIIRSKKDLF